MALGVSERVIQKHASELGLTVNGKQTELDERAVTIIKAKIERSGRTDLAHVCELPKITTDLEMMALDMKVSAWKTQKIKELQKQLEEAKPKIEFYDAVTESTDTIDIGNCAKILAIKGMGRNKLFELLREKGVLRQNNEPYQKFVDAGLLRVIETSFQATDGSTHINRKTVVFQKGLDYIRKVVTQ